MPRGQRAAAHIIGLAAPFLKGLEASLDDAVLSPEREERRAHAAPGLAVGAIVLEVDRGGRAIVLAARVDHLRREAALVLRPCRGRERRDARASRPELPAQQ